MRVYIRTDTHTHVGTVLMLVSSFSWPSFKGSSQLPRPRQRRIGFSLLFDVDQGLDLSATISLNCHNAI